MLNIRILKNVYVIPFNKSIYRCINVNPQFQFTNQLNLLSYITHECRLIRFRFSSLIVINIELEDRIIRNYRFFRLCPIETPERNHVGMVNSPSFNSQLRIDYQLYNIINTYKNSWFIFIFDKIGIKFVVFFIIIIKSKWKQILIFKILNIIKKLNTFHNIIFDNFQLYRNLKIKNFVTIFYIYFVIINIDPEYKFSFSTNIIPFLKYNDRIRILIGANIIRQAFSRIKVFLTCFSIKIEMLIKDININIRAD